jgi:hypothetical protein
MNMKRLFSTFLAVCLLAGASGVACAESSPLRVLAGNAQTAEAYRQAYPDRAVQVIDVDYEQGYRGNLAELLAGGDWDVAFIGTQEFDLAALADEGLSADLGAFPAIAARADNLCPSIRAAATVGGKLVAFPAGYVAGMVMGIRLMGVPGSYSDEYTRRAAAHLETLGFTQDDQPRTFAQLCALGERYMRQPGDARRGTAFITVEGNQTAYVLNLLIDLYASQYLATGEYASFDTEVFRTALSQAAALGAALAADPKNTYDDDGLCFPLLNDCSQLILGDGVFLQLGEHRSLPARMNLAVVNPESPNAQAAVDYILFSDEKNACYSAPALYQSVDYDALVRQSYDEDIAAQIEQHEDQSVIDRLIALRDAGDTSRYAYTEAEIERYRTEVAPLLVFPQADAIDTQSAARQYLLGKLDADGFIAALNQAAAR